MENQNGGNFLYFAEDPVETTNEAIMVPVSSYNGCNPTATTTTEFFFDSVDGTPTREVVELTHGVNDGKHVIDAMARIMGTKPHSPGMIVVADAEIIAGAANKPNSVFHKEFRGTVTGCAIA